jgi:hypothetical protein
MLSPPQHQPSTALRLQPTKHCKCSGCGTADGRAAGLGHWHSRALTNPFAALATTVLCSCHPTSGAVVLPRHLQMVRFRARVRPCVPSLGMRRRRPPRAVIVGHGCWDSVLRHRPPPPTRALAYAEPWESAVTVGFVFESLAPRGCDGQADERGGRAQGRNTVT